MSNRILIDLVKGARFSYGYAEPQRGHITSFKDIIYPALRVFGRVGIGKEKPKRYYVNKIQYEFLKEECLIYEKSANKNIGE